MRLSRILAVALGLSLAVGVAAEGIRWSWDSKSVAAGAAIDSGVQPTGGSTDLSCYVTNADATATRNFVVKFLADDKTTTLFQATISIPTNATNGGYAAVSVGLGATASSNVTVIPALPSRWMQFQLASAGTSAGRVVCVGR